MKSHLHFPLFQNIRKKWGSPAILKSYGRLKVVMFFTIFARKNVLTHAQTFNFDAPARPCSFMEMAQNCKM